MFLRGVEVVFEDFKVFSKWFQRFQRLLVSDVISGSSREFQRGFQWNLKEVGA